MKRKITTKELRIVSMTMACWGLLFIGSGIAMTTQDRTVLETTYILSISQNKVAESKTNEIKLKDMKLEIDNPISVNIKDYLEDVDNLEASVLKALKLDTSNVNIHEAGIYTYTISYKKKKYNGTFTIIEKELPKVNLTLRNLTLKKDSVLDTSLSTYIVEKLSDEVANNIILDLSNVKTNVEGTYQYSVTYNNKLYTANIEIYTPQAPIVITPNNPENKEENNNNKLEENKTEENLEQEK